MRHLFHEFFAEGNRVFQFFLAVASILILLVVGNY